MHGHMNKLFEGLEVGMENKGEKLLITVSGDKEKIKILEKKLNAIKELCSDEEGCCSCC